MINLNVIDPFGNRRRALYVKYTIRRTITFFVLKEACKHMCSIFGRNTRAYDACGVDDRYSSRVLVDTYKRVYVETAPPRSQRVRPTLREWVSTISVCRGDAAELHSRRDCCCMRADTTCVTAREREGETEKEAETETQRRRDADTPAPP